MPNYRSPVWTEVAPPRRFPRLDGNLSVDVAIVGAGITGLTTAFLLKRAGLRVAVLESRRVGKGESSKTTAHLTEVLDTPFATLISRFGADGARLAVRGQRLAIERIASTVEELRISCGFLRVPGYLFTETHDGLDDLESEADTARRLGLTVERLPEAPLPFATRGAVLFQDQAQFNPREYVAALAEWLPGDGSHVFEQTHVVDVDEGEPCRVITEQGVVIANDVVVAAHVPISNRLLVHLKLTPNRTYAVAAEMDHLADMIGLFWDTARPYHYIRTQMIDGATFLIVGGEDHKVGEEEDTLRPFRRLEEYFERRFGKAVAPTDHRWSGQIIEPADGLPYVGHNAMSSHVYVATGYAGNGMTQGTLAASIISEQIRGIDNPWSELYAATRFKPLASAARFLSQNADYPRHLVGDRLGGSNGGGLDEIAPGEGSVVTVEGQRLAVYRNERGEVSAVSPVCTHLGCLVHWNTVEKSWDCPCHGSRYDAHGRVLNGPAVEALAARPIPNAEEGEAALELEEGLPA